MSEWVLLAAGMLARGQIDDKPSPVPPTNGVVRQTDPAPVPRTPNDASVELPTLDLPEFSTSDRTRSFSSSTHFLQNQLQNQLARHTRPFWAAAGSPSNFSLRIAGIPAQSVPSSVPRLIRVAQPAPNPAQTAIATAPL